jgi:uncharacterized membrane protein
MTEPQEQEQVQAPQEAPAEEQAQPVAQEQAPVAAEPQSVPGVGFLVMAFNDEKAADQALDAMKQAKKQKQFYFEDAAVIRQDAKGKVHYSETGDMSTGKGAGIGALVGGVLSLLGGPIGLAVGAGIGALAGAAAASKDSGFRNESLNMVGVALKPQTSALVAITSNAFLRAVQKEVPIEDIRATVANLSGEISAALAEKKDLAIGVLLTEGALAIKKIALNETSAEVVGAVFTDEAVVAGAAYVDAEGAAYQVVAATKEGAVMEAGVITEEGAVIVDAVALPEVAEAAAENKLPAEEAPKEAPAAEAAPEAPAADVAA